MYKVIKVIRMPKNLAKCLGAIKKLKLKVFCKNYSSYDF